MKVIGSFMPDKYTLICRFPIWVLFEKDRLGGGVLKPEYAGLDCGPGPTKALVDDPSGSVGAG